MEGTADGQHFAKVLSPIPLQELHKTLPNVPDAVAGAFNRLGYTSLASIIVAIDAPPRTDQSWVYFPHPETGPFTRLTHLSNYSPGNAPEGASSVMLEVTYRGDLKIDQNYLDAVVENVVDCGIADKEQVLFAKAFQNKYAYILYLQDLEENLETVKSWLASQDLDILGRFGNYDYFNSDQCIKAVMDYVAELPH